MDDDSETSFVKVVIMESPLTTYLHICVVPMHVLPLDCSNPQFDALITKVRVVMRFKGTHVIVLTIDLFLTFKGNPVSHLVSCLNNGEGLKCKGLG